MLYLLLSPHSITITANKVNHSPFLPTGGLGYGGYGHGIASYAVAAPVVRTTYISGGYGLGGAYGYHGW